MKRYLQLALLAAALALAGPARAVTVTNPTTAPAKVTETNPLNQQFYYQPNVYNNTIAAGAVDSTFIYDFRGYRCMRLDLWGVPAGGVAKTRLEIQVRGFAVADKDTSFAGVVTTVALGSSAALITTAYVDSTGDVGVETPNANMVKAGSFIYVLDPNRRLGWAGGVSGYPYGTFVNLVGEGGGCVNANYYQIWIRNISTSGTARLRITVEGNPF